LTRRALKKHRLNWPCLCSVSRRETHCTSTPHMSVRTGKEQLFQIYFSCADGS